VFTTEDDLYSHFKLRHCFDDNPTVSNDRVEDIGFVVCPKCFKVFKRGRLHPNKKCRLPRHIDAAMSVHHASNNQAFREQFWDFHFGALRFGEHLPSINQVFFTSAPILDYLPGGEDLHSDFRKIFIVIARYLERGEYSREEAVVAWTLLFALPRLLLSIPLDKEQGSSHSMTLLVQRRISCFFDCYFTKLNGDFNAIIDARSRLPNGPRRENADVTAKRIIGLIKNSGEIGKAGRRLESTSSLADISDPFVLDKVRDLLIEDGDHYEVHCVTHDQPCPSLNKETVYRAVAKMKRSTAGVTGWHKTHLAAIASSGDGLSALTFVVNAIFKRELPPALNDVINNSTITALSKKDGGIRPICISDVFIRLIAKCTVILEQDFIAKSMSPLQVAVGTRGGAEIAIHGIRAHLDANPNHIAVAIDLKNAFGTIPRMEIARALNKLSLDSTTYTRWFFNHFGVPASRVVLPGGRWFSYNVGVPQGGPTSMQWFCLAIQDLLREAHQRLSPSGGTVISYADDTFLVGEATHVLETFKLFVNSAACIGLHHRISKCQIVSPIGKLPAESRQLAQELGFSIHPPKVIMVLGSPVGDESAEQDATMDLIDPGLFTRLSFIDDYQCRLLLLRYCIATKYTHLARTICPAQAKECLTEIDSLTLHAFGALVLQHDVDTFPSHVQEQITLPLSEGGLSLKSLVAESEIDYYASASFALLHWRNVLEHDHPILTLKGTRTSAALSSALTHVKELVKSGHEDNIQYCLVDPVNPEKRLPDLPQADLPKSLKDMMGKPTPNNHHLQRDLSRFQARRTFRNLWNSTSKDSAQRIQILDNTTGTPSLALTALPTEPGLQLTNIETVIMLRQYLSMPLEPVLGLPLSKPLRCCCSVQFGPKKETCSGTHLFNCNKQSAFTQRHEAVKAVVQECYKSAGIIAEVERPVSSVPRVSQAGKRLNPKRFDLWAPAPDFVGKNYCIDISIVSHVSKEHFQKATETVLHSANEQVTLKSAKYRADVQHETEVLVPLCAQSNGAMHKHFGVLFAQLGERVNGLPPLQANWASPTFAAYWLQRTSCTIWRETARGLLRISKASSQLAGNVLPSIRPAGYSDPESDTPSPNDA